MCLIALHRQGAITIAFIFTALLQSRRESGADSTVGIGGGSGGNDRFRVRSLHSVSACTGARTRVRAPAADTVATTYSPPSWRRASNGIPTTSAVRGGHVSGS